MPIERKYIKKSYLVLCEGKDAELFLIHYLNSKALAYDRRFSSEIQVFDFGGNNDLCDFLMNLKNMDGFAQVRNLAVVRDAESDYDKACHEVNQALERCDFVSPGRCGTWAESEYGVKTGFMLFPFDNNAGTLEDLCLRMLSERKSEFILSSIDGFLSEMESSYKRSYSRKHKNKLHTYLSSSDKYVTMPLGLASKAGAFDWSSKALEPLKSILEAGF